MEVPLELSFHGVDHTDWAEEYVRKRVARLQQFAKNIIACRVTIEQPHHHRHQGNPFRVRIEVTLPQKKDLVATAEPVQVEQENQLHPVIRQAFEAMERQLERANERQHHEVKSHTVPTGLVVRLYSDRGGYGFIKTPEGREFYFHRNSVLHGDWERLAVGTEVRFEPEEGEEGPQASTVQIINKPGARESEGSARDEIPPGWRGHR